MFFTNEDLHSREKMACEAAGIYRHYLIGPSGTKNIDWLAVQAGTIARPQENQGVLRNMLNKSAIPAQDIPQRQQILSEELASKLHTWSENEYLTDILVWIGHEGAWEQFKTTCHSAGVILPKHAITNNHNPEIMDWIIDRLHDEKHPCKRILCIGMHCPEYSPLSECNITPKAEWAFCLLFGSPDQHKVSLTRPVEIYHYTDFKRSQKNATISKEPSGGYLQIAENLWLEAAEASWMKTPGRLQEHWGDTHPYTPWLTLVLAIILCEEKKQPFGWLAEANKTKWAGIVTFKES